MCGYPTIATTGVKAGIPLTPSGDLIIRAGGTWQNLDVRGCISVETTQPVVLRNIQVTPANPDLGCNGNISKFNSGTLLIEDVTSYCTVASGHGFYVANTTARRVQTHGCENGFEANENTVITDSWIQGSENPKAPGKDPHGDGLQSQGGNNVLIQHNTMVQVGSMTSTIITNPTENNGWTLVDNLFGGGGYTLYCPEQGQNFAVRGNRFVPAKTGAPGSAAYGLTDACNHGGITWSGNYRDDNPALTVTKTGASV